MGSMNVFVIHSGKDEARILELLDYIQQHAQSLNHNIQMTQQKQKPPKFWKRSVKKSIRSAQLVMFFVGENSFSSQNIGWEIQTAIKFKKRIVYLLLDKDNQLPSALYYQDKYSKALKIYGEYMTVDQVIRLINEYQEGRYHLLNRAAEGSPNTAMLFDQYKLFLQTSESLVSRRQSVNSFYITLNTSLLAVFTPISSLITDKKLKIIVILIFLAMGLILCVSWRQLLDSYGNLNSSKMKILSILEKELPASLYDAEWEAMSDQLNNRRYVSFTASEKRIPMIFIVLYLIISAVLIIYFVFVNKTGGAETAKALLSLMRG